MIVEKKTFEMPTFTTRSGRVLRNVQVGWESYGTLATDASNAVLVTHFFSGTSHAAGRYTASDLVPGYWDAIIGPGKAVDTNRFFVVASDTLVNLNTGDPRVVTTGPASIDPDTRRPYGLDFPVVGIGDFVEVQRALLDSLGIGRLYAVMGPSMGGLQAYEWAVRYPKRVARVVPVIAAGEAPPWLIAWLDVWAAPIRLDPSWNGGDYHGRQPPLDGLTQALKVVGLQAQHWDWAQATFGRAPASLGGDPAATLAGGYAVQAGLEAAALARARVCDANHFLYLAKANQMFAAGGEGIAALSRVEAKALVIHAPGDQVFPAAWARASVEAMRAGGVRVETADVEGPNGHYNGIANMAPLSPTIARFLDTD